MSSIECLEDQKIKDRHRDHGRSPWQARATCNNDRTRSSLAHIAYTPWRKGGHTTTTPPLAISPDAKCHVDRYRRSIASERYRVGVVCHLSLIISRPPTPPAPNPLRQAS